MDWTQTIVRTGMQRWVCTQDDGDAGFMLSVFQTGDGIDWFVDGPHSTIGFGTARTVEGAKQKALFCFVDNVQRVGGDPRSVPPTHEGLHWIGNCGGNDVREALAFYRERYPGLELVKFPFDPGIPLGPHFAIYARELPDAQHSAG